MKIDLVFTFLLDDESFFRLNQEERQLITKHVAKVVKHELSNLDLPCTESYSDINFRGFPSDSSSSET